MKYQYRFKNKELFEAVSTIFGQEYVEKELKRQMPDEFDYFILETADHNKINSSALIPKEEVESTRVYDPNDWNPFPEVNPPECGEYLVTFKDEDADYVQQNYFDNLGRWETAHSDVIAFRALPAPYQPEKTK